MTLQDLRVLEGSSRQILDAVGHSVKIDLFLVVGVTWDFQGRSEQTFYGGKFWGPSLVPRGLGASNANGKAITVNIYVKAFTRSYLFITFWSGVA